MGRGGTGGEEEERLRECLDATFKDLPPPLHRVQVRGGNTLPVQ